MISNNLPASRHHGAAQHGDALLAGLVRCRRCGQKLTPRYTGAQHHIPRYSCNRGWMDHGMPRCVSFGGLRVDDAIEAAPLSVVGPGAIAAAVTAAQDTARRRDQVDDALGRDLEAARYAADRARRQYDAADPANRVGGGRVGKALECGIGARSGNRSENRRSRGRRTDHRRDSRRRSGCTDAPRRRLKSVWTAPSTDARRKKRIVRTVIHEVIADIDDTASDIVLVVHWAGGVHSEIRLPKQRRGQRNGTSADIIVAVRQLVLIAGDDVIAGILNRNGLVTGNGNRWTRERVTSLRSHHRIPVHKPADDGNEPWLNLNEAAKVLHVRV